MPASVAASVTTSVADDDDVERETSAHALVVGVVADEALGARRRVAGVIDLTDVVLREQVLTNKHLRGKKARE